MRRLLLLAGLFGCALVAPGLAQAASPDGTGALAYTGSPVANPSTGNVLTFTFSLAGGESFQEGEILITAPSGWSTPTTNPTDPGYTTSDCGFVETGTLGAQTIWIQGMNTSGPATCTITYGAAPGPGVSVPASTPGPAVFSTQTRATLGGTFQPIASPPEVHVLAADGTGALDYTGFPVAGGSGDNGFEFDFSLQSDEEFQNGALQITVPTGWSAPSTNSADEGYTTSTCGTVGAVGQVITVTGITLTGPTSCEVFYGDLPGPGVTTPTTPGPYTFDTETKATSAGTFTAIGTSPEVDVLAPDGSGTMESDTLSVGPSSTGNNIEFTYTAAFGGLFGGMVAITVPLGWSDPSDNPSDPGYITTSDGGPFTFIDRRTFYVDFVVLGVLGAPDQLHIEYGGTSGGATAPAISGNYGWKSASQATCNCSSRLLRLMADSPHIRVRAADGTGTASVAPTQASAVSMTTFTLKYKPDAGGMENGEIQVDVPAGWTAPQTSSPGSPGYVTSSAGTASASGQEIHVSGLTLFGDFVRIQYRGAVGSVTGPQSLTVSQRSSTGGILTPLPSSPLVNVYAADGSGTMTTPTLTVPHGSPGNRITFTYTAAAGGTSNGIVGLKIPAGWSLPTTNSSLPGYTTASTGAVTISGQTILATGVTLGSGGTMTITYGAVPGPGAIAPSTIGPNTFTAYSRTTNVGVTTALALSPTIATT
jgi:hypothetical protein